MECLSLWDLTILTLMENFRFVITNYKSFKLKILKNYGDKNLIIGQESEHDIGYRILWTLPKCFLDQFVHLALLWSTI
jgi:hypothetical protein